MKKEEKIEPSKYTDVLIQIQHSVNVHYTTHNIPSHHHWLKGFKVHPHTKKDGHL